MTIVSVRLTKKQQIAQRRSLVLELYSRGYSQEEITDRLKPDVLHISQKTVSRDLAWLEKNAIEYVKNHRETLAMEYQQVRSNLQQLRKKAWKLMEKAEDEDDTQLQRDMFGIIESLNAAIVHVRAIGDIVSNDLIKQSKESATQIQKDMEKAIEQNHFRHSSAIF